MYLIYLYAIVSPVNSVYSLVLCVCDVCIVRCKGVCIMCMIDFPFRSKYSCVTIDEGMAL